MSKFVPPATSTAGVGDELAALRDQIRLCTESVSVLTTALPNEQRRGSQARNDAAVATEMRGTLEAALAAQARRVESSLEQMRAATTTQMQQVQAHIADAHRDVVAASDRSHGEFGQLNDASAALGDLLQTRFALVMSVEDDRFDEVRALLASVVGPLEAVRETLVRFDRAVDEQSANQRQDRHLTQEVSDQVGELSARLDEGLADVGDALQAHRNELAHEMASFRASLDADAEHVQNIMRATARVVGEDVRDTVARVNERFVEESSARSQSLSQMVEEVLERLSVRMDDARDRMLETTEALASLEHDLVDHLTRRDQLIAQERADLTRRFVEELAGQLTRRERHRLAQRLELPITPGPVPSRLADVLEKTRESHDRDARLTVPSVLSSSSSRATEGPTTSTDPVRPGPAGRSALGPPRGRWTESAPTGTDAPVIAPMTDRPAPQTADEAPAPPAATPTSAAKSAQVRPSRASKPVQRRAPDPQDPAAVRRQLAGIRGLGPTRQSALIDAFGTLEAIREANDEQLLDVPGIGPALLAPIRDGVR